MTNDINSSSHTLTRSLAPAALEITANYPSIYLKNLVQQGRALPRPSMREARNCYRGFSACAAGVIPSKGAMLGTGNEVKCALDQANMHAAHTNQVLAGAIGGTVAALIASPFELLTVQKQQQPELTVKDFAKQLGEHPIANGVFRGLILTVARDSIYSAMVLGVSPTVKAELPAPLRDSITGTLCAATLTGATAAMLTQPLDTLKTLTQGSSLKQPPKSLSQLLANKDLSSLYKGSAFRLYRITKGAAIILGAQEMIDKAFQNSDRTR